MLSSSKQFLFLCNIVSSNLKFMYINARKEGIIMKKETSIGNEIRKLRNFQGSTLQELADRCGCSKSLLSKVENGKVMPSVATLVKIASSLGTTVSALLEENSQISAVFTTWEEVEANFIGTDKGYRISAVATQYQSKKMQPFFFRVKDKEVKRHSVRHDGEEFVLVIEGSINFQVGHVKYTLHEGDSLYFNASEDHYVSPLSENATYLDIFV